MLLFFLIEFSVFQRSFKYEEEEFHRNPVHIPPSSSIEGEELSLVQPLYVIDTTVVDWSAIPPPVVLLFCLCFIVYIEMQVTASHHVTYRSRLDNIMNCEGILLHVVSISSSCIPVSTLSLRIVIRQR